MPRPNKRSRTLRRVFVRIPSGISKLTYKARKPSRIKCAECKTILHGISAMSKAELRNISNSQKKVARKYGGNLCHKCARKRIIDNIRKQQELK